MSGWSKSDHTHAAEEMLTSWLESWQDFQRDLNKFEDEDVEPGTLAYDSTLKELTLSMLAQQTVLKAAEVHAMLANSMRVQ